MAVGYGGACFQHLPHEFLATKTMSNKDILPPDDREIILARFTVYFCDLREECRHFASFRMTGDLPACAAAIMDDVYSMLDLSVPLPARYAFIKDPDNHL